MDFEFFGEQPGNQIAAQNEKKIDAEITGIESGNAAMIRDDQPRREPSQSHPTPDCIEAMRSTEPPYYNAAPCRA